MRSRKGTTRHARGVALLAVAMGVAVAACASATTGPREREVLLGGLFSLTGNGATRGQSGRTALELAVDDVNRYLTGNAAGIRFVAAVEDTRLEPGRALERARALQARGVQLMIGAQTSAEVEALKAFVDGNDVLLVSPSSTAGTLTIAGDNIFRFTPADSLEGVAVSVLMWQDGVRAIVPVWRADAGNAGLEKATRARFRALGGTVLDGVVYNADRPDFSATVARLEAQLRQAVQQHGAERVAVYLAGFDEVAALFELANADPLLCSVAWYGSDGTAQSDALLVSPASVEFAIRTGYPNPSFGLEAGAREIWEPVRERIRARTGADPEAYAFAVYDAVWVVARGYVASGATRDIGTLKRAFITAAATQYGATGWTVLNDAGDRRYGDFDFWAIRRVDGVPRWMRVAQYESRTERLIR